MGEIPFPGDLLINENPYKTESYLGYNPASFPNKAQGQDVITQMYPWRHFSIEELKKGNLPFWNPHNFSGNPQLANFQTGIFYPFNILYFVLPFNFVWTVLIMLQPILAGIFMYLFLSRGLNLLKFAAFLGGIAFAFSSFMTVWIEYGNIGSTFLWLPLVLLFTKRFSQKITVFNFFLIVFPLTFALLAGFIQVLFYIYVLSFLYFLCLLKFKRPEDWQKKLTIFLTALILPLALSSFQLLPTYEIFKSSTRGFYTLSQFSNLLLPPYYFITAFVPDFFGNPATRNYFISGTYIERVMYPGVSIIFFAFLAIRFIKSLESRFFMLVGSLSLFVATNLPGVKYLYLLPIPVISTTVPTRELSLFIFSIIVLGAMGISYFLSNNKLKTRIPLIFISIYLVLWIIVIVLDLKISIRNLILPSFLAISTVTIFYTSRISKKLSLLALALIVIFDLFYFFNKITPFSPTDFIYPKTPVVSYLKENAGINRFWGYGDAYVKPNFQTFDKTYSPEGNDSLYIKSYGELLVSSANGKLPEVLPRRDANIAPGYGSSDLADNFYRQRILNLLGVKYVLNKSLVEAYDNTFPREKYKLLWQKTPWQIYENKEALPRFFMTSEYKVFKNKSEVLKNIYNKDLDLKKFLLLEEEPLIPVDKNSKGEVKLISYEPNRIIFDTKSDGNNLLFLSDNYYPQWKAVIDGKPSKVLLADYTFRAVSLPKGEHRIEFFYNPLLFLRGLKISVIGLLVLFGIAFWLKKYGKI